ncbi:hypothetical protein B0H14DRAFT_2594382 [Mycena olivaceomarginata]|nr:hypothetical protein B0H14DRAFT_2594382 [Mycena olivaceomarginata]
MTTLNPESFLVVPDQQASVQNNPAVIEEVLSGKERGVDVVKPRCMVRMVSPHAATANGGRDDATDGDGDGAAPLKMMGTGGIGMSGMLPLPAAGQMQGMLLLANRVPMEGEHRSLSSSMSGPVNGNRNGNTGGELSEWEVALVKRNERHKEEKQRTN